MSVRFQWCAPCGRAGHRCPAASLRARELGRREEPVCLDCLDERPCAAVRVAGRAREESGVRAERVFSDYGLPEVVFPGVDMAVVHRTPEELGIARVVAGNAEERRCERVAQQRERERIEAAERKEPRREAARGDSNQNGQKRGAPKPSTQRRDVMSTQATVGRPRGVPSKRYGMPTFGAVSMDVVPESVVVERVSAADTIYRQLVELPAGQALKVDFEAESHADYVRFKVRARAKKDKRFCSTSRSEDGKTRYFWLEPVA